MRVGFILAIGLTMSTMLFIDQVFAESIILGYEYGFMQEMDDRMDRLMVDPDFEESIPFDTFIKNNDTYIAMRDLPRIDEELYTGIGLYDDIKVEALIYNDVELAIYFYTNGKLKETQKQHDIFSTQHIPILKDGKIYIPLKLIKEELGYEVIIPKVREPQEDETKNLKPLVPVKGTKLGYIEINGKLCQVRYIEHSLDNLVNISDYARYMPCLWSYNKSTNILEVRRGVRHYAEFEPGRYKYKYAGIDRIMDPPVERIGDDFYVGMHLLARIKKDVYNFTPDGKYISITTQEFIMKQRHTEREKYIDNHGKEAWDKEERNRVFLGNHMVALGYDFYSWGDSLPMRPYNPDGTRLITNYTKPLALNLSEESLTKTGEQLKMGPFTVPLYKGTIRYTSNPAFKKGFISEIRHPFGLMLNYYKQDGKNHIEMSVAKNADIELVTKELYSIFAPQYTSQQVQAFTDQVFKTGQLIGPELDKAIKKQKQYISSYAAYVVNTRNEYCYDRFDLGAQY